MSHIRLGTTISVTLSGPAGKREATALGLDDLPAVYSQMVRSLTTGQPMGIGVLDRTNVSASQDLPPPPRPFGRLLVHPSGIWQPFRSVHAQWRVVRLRLSRGIQPDRPRRVVFQRSTERHWRLPRRERFAWSLVKLQALYFTSPTTNRSAYFGGGLSYGRTELQVSTSDAFSGTSYGHGSGLQAGLTAGYEIARATSARVFVQADVTLPFYNVHVETFLVFPAPTKRPVRRPRR